MRKLVEYARRMERKGLIHVENLARVSYLADIAFSTKRKKSSTTSPCSPASVVS